MGDEDEWPPTFDIDLSDRRRAVMDCFELMERLVDEYGGRGRIRKISDERISVEIEYDLPEDDDG